MKTHSNTGLGTRSQDEFFAMTGNEAPLSEPMSMMNTEAILRWKNVSAPPPVPQLRSVVDMTRLGK